MSGWLHTEMVYLSTVTHPSSNRARCRATSLIETKALTTTPGCEVRLPAVSLSGNNYEASRSHTHVPRSPGTIMWYVRAKER